MKKRLLTTILVVTLISLLPVLSQKKLTACQYWIDNGERVETAFTGNDITLAINASGIEVGLHTLNYRVKDSEGMFSPLQTWIFLRKEAEVVAEKTMAACQYWIDNGERNETAFTGNDIALTIDASNIEAGLHTLNYRVKDSQGMYSPLQIWIFLKKETSGLATTRKLAWMMYWWNDRTDLAVKEKAANDSTAYVFARKVLVPEYARTDTVSYTARLYFVVGDDAGFVSAAEYADVEYSDHRAPVTEIEAGAVTDDGCVVLTWRTVSDMTTDYNIYYSEDDEPFVLWLPNTTEETATFRGQAGKSYRFAVTARDKFSNQGIIDLSKSVEVTF